jgi:hypothetical protein
LMTRTIACKEQPSQRKDKIHGYRDVNHSIHLGVFEWQCNLIGILSKFRAFASNSFHSRLIWSDCDPNFIHSHAIWFDFELISFDSWRKNLLPEDLVWFRRSDLFV